MVRFFVLASLCAAAGACSDGNGTPVDATPTVDIDNGSCGDQLRFTGELIDWDSTDASFCGVPNAEVEVAGGAMDSTAPNGRFDLCVPRDAATVALDVTPPATASGCITQPGTYTLPAIAVATKAVVLAGGFWSGRMITGERQVTFFQQAGVTFDAAKAHVIVHVEGTPRGVAIAATHGPAQAFSGTAWAAGETGKDVFFPNVDVASGSTSLMVVGGAIGTGSIPLVPGKLTMVSVLAN